ncbi:MAG TPA: ABC transporter substrate-binding protein [Candidatus Sulfotelmatobacter sp.]|nr:ABC transporter substrate-binding protein [Candidatus Sulfotelmatobacter sp.]
MRRREFLAATAATLAMPAVARSQSSRVLTVVPQADLAVLDPIWTTSYQTRDHAFLVFDTLFGVDASFKAQPQMVEGAVAEDDGKRWRLVLRSGLKFHDGTPVLARDCVASVRRWGARDAFGQALMAATGEVSASDDKTIVFRMKRPFPLLPDALGKAPPSICAIMPERLAATDPQTQVTEMVGSGPYHYKPDERMPGARVVYERFADYVPRAQGTPSGTAGPKLAHFDRVEWRIIPEGGTIAAALQRGEVDWWLIPDADLLAPLKRDPKLAVRVVDPTGFIATMRFNHLHPPFDNPAMRRALLGALKQSDYLIAMVGTDPSLWRDRCGFFCPGTPMASDVGLDALNGPRDLDAVKRAITAAGYKGERIVLLGPTNIASAKALADVTHDLLKTLGLNVDYQAMDWATLVQRRTKQEPVDQGGWSLYHTSWSGADQLNPAGHVFLRGNGTAATVGWPTSPALEALRDRWFEATDLGAQQKITAAMQQQAFQDVPYIPLGQYFLPAVHQVNLTGVLDGNPVFWNVRRG